MKFYAHGEVYIIKSQLFIFEGKKWSLFFSLYIDMCSDIFGKQFVVEMIQENIHSSNLFYGGINKYNVNLYSLQPVFSKTMPIS